MQRRHQEVAERFGNQPDRVRDAAEEQHYDRRVEHDPADVTSRAVTFARDRTLERDAVVDERAILRDALQRSLGEARIEDIKREVDRRVERGDFVAVDTEAHAPGRSFTTPAMLQLEQETIERMRGGQAKHDVLARESTRVAVQQEHPHMSESQRTAVNEVLASRDQVMGLDGTAGAGKTTTLAVIRDAAEREGYHVGGFAPTSRAAQKLEEAGGDRTCEREARQPAVGVRGRFARAVRRSNLHR
jgi:flagellar biosynthesis GTPase FlhF